MSEPTDFDWEAESGLNRMTVERLSSGGLVVTVGHGPAGRRTQVSLRLPSHAADDLAEWMQEPRW